MLRIGIIGCGAIAEAIVKGSSSLDRIKITGLYDRHPEKVSYLSGLLREPPEALTFDDMLGACDLIIEAASQGAVKEFVPPALEAGKDVMIMSVGALGDQELLDRIKRIAEANNCKIYIPSGAIAGVDGVKAAAGSKIKRVRLTTRKPPRAFGVENEENAMHERVLFEGPAREAVKLFPANVNVSLTLSLAGMGPDRTEVRIIQDPSIDLNIHEVEVEGDFGRMHLRFENLPSPSNPKTSFLAALSAIALIKRVSEPIEVGT
ncbi:MAG TPA: aspartate dehydrogenase [Candidatus Syntrophoarchaeum butanivorans]|uniref:L-aspartate dehydrogenase n=1 Tax=Candidatus Syntropharchaeum butanivorans TaxID=1839936 RepID=A0A7C0X210_9EURY|nr:aspartate dehydrogenase [Candidatus Syntrophoarchaeum butanivorans]